MKHYLYFILFAFFSLLLQAQDSKKVLFLGNSYTAFNNLPSMVSNMATSTGNTLVYDSNTPGGYRFLNHVTNATTLNKINSNDWDYVVLQAQSQETSLDQTEMETDVYPHATTLCNAIRANNECSEPMFYMTWGRENGDAGNCGTYPWVCTYEGMDDAIRTTYTFMANENLAEVSPVGAVWRFLRENHPEIDLYSGDGSHPSLTGSYVAAAVFYTMIYKLDPTLITWNSSLSETDASTIKLVAKTVVYNVITDWDFTVNPANSNFTTTIINGEVTFDNVDNLDSYSWDFGDSNMSTASNPTHTYLVNGDYMVSLTVTKCGETSTYTQSVLIDNLSTPEFDLIQSISLSPNPVKNELNINFNTIKEDIVISLNDITGKQVLKKEMDIKENTVIDMSVLSSGLYLLNISSGDRLFITKILKE
jgi:PKD repeat protein